MGDPGGHEREAQWGRDQKEQVQFPRRCGVKYLPQCTIQKGQLRVGRPAESDEKGQKERSRIRKNAKRGTFVLGEVQIVVGAGG